MPLGRAEMHATGTQPINGEWMGTEWMNNFRNFERVESSESNTDFRSSKRFIFWQRLKNETNLSLSLPLCLSPLYVAQMYAPCKTQERITQFQKDEVHCDTIMKTWIWTAAQSECGHTEWSEYTLQNPHSGQSKGTKFYQLISHATVWEWHCFRHCCLVVRRHEISRVRFQLFVTFIGFVYALCLPLRSFSALTVYCRPILLSVEMQMSHLGSDLLNSPVLRMPLDLYHEVCAHHQMLEHLCQSPHFKYIKHSSLYTLVHGMLHLLLLTAISRIFESNCPICHCPFTIYKQL